jgi:hypothetical protein
MMDILAAAAELEKIATRPNGMPWEWLPGVGGLGVLGTLFVFLVKSKLRPRAKFEFGDFADQKPQAVCPLHGGLAEQVGNMEQRQQAIHVLVAGTDAKLGLLLQLKGINPLEVKVPPLEVPQKQSPIQM